MFYALLLVTFSLALVVSLFVGTVFRTPVTLLLGRILGDEIGEAWGRYTPIALAIAGVAGGVPMFELERMVGLSSAKALVLNGEQWVLTVYGTVIATLGSVAGALMLFFVVCVIAQVFIRRGEGHRPGPVAADAVPPVSGA